jgi:hypothetical protein
MRFFGPDPIDSASADTGNVPKETRRQKPPYQDIEINVMLQRNLCRAIGLAKYPRTNNEEHPGKIGGENKSLFKVNKELSKFVQGSLVAMGQNSTVALRAFLPTATTPCRDQIYDLGPVALRHVVDHLRADYYKTGADNQGYQVDNAERVKGVRLNCTGDEHIAMRPFESVEASESLCGQESDMTAEIAEKIGIPLLIRKIPQAILWRGRRYRGMPCAQSNRPMAFELQKQHDTSMALKTMAEFEQMTQRADEVASQMGSCVAVRKDGQPMESTFMMALLEYARRNMVNAITFRYKDVLQEVSEED